MKKNGKKMDSKEVYEFIRKRGFRTLKEVKTNFSTENQEILDALIVYLVSKAGVKKISFQDNSDVDYILYISPTL